MTARPRRWPWLLAALLLLGAGALLWSQADPPSPPRASAPDFPSHFREPELRRQAARRTLELPAAAAPRDAAAPAPQPPPRQDPLLQALPLRPGEPVVVFEANALRHSRLGELFVQCALADDPTFFERARQASGIDVLKDVDRVAFAGESVVISGFFGQARWDQLGRDQAAATPYGDQARIYGTAGRGQVLGVWRDQLLLIGPDEATVRASVDQLEGRAPAPAPALLDDLAYGEVYGLLPAEAIRRMASPADRELADRLAAAASRVELHVDAMQDVAAVVRVEGADSGALRDLSRTLGGALAAGRLQAKASGDGPLADLLDAARVTPGDGRFALEMALPASTLERWFEGCAGRRTPRPPAAP